MKYTIWLTTLLLALTGLRVHAEPPGAAAGVAALVAEAGRIGKETRLPPHLVEVLGLGTHAGGLAVRQLALRQGSVVRTFNVSAENAQDVVIFDYDEASRATLVCLLTPAAKLRRALTYTAGDAPHVLAKPEARRRFAPELDYWLAILRSGSPASR